MYMNKHGIHRVAKLTGISKDVIRLWERGYGFVTPSRSSNRYREYSDEDVAGEDASGVAAEPCLPDSSARWLLPDGATLENDDDYIVVMNPYATDAVVSLTLLSDGRGEPVRTEEWTNVTLNPFHSRSIKLDDKARFRDLNRLREMELLFLDDKNQLWPGFVRPKNIKMGGKRGS